MKSYEMSMKRRIRAGRQDAKTERFSRSARVGKKIFLHGFRLLSHPRDTFPGNPPVYSGHMQKVGS
jgi:hypothetical protein